MRWFVFILALTSGASWASAHLSGRLSNLTGYFFEPAKVRHHRYELSLTQKTALSDNWNSNIEVRARADLALSDLSFAPQRDLPRSVKDNEFLEAEFRELYLDYLGDSFRLKAGLQFFDWIEFLSIYSSGLLTPLDLRYGAFGAYKESLVPVPAVSLNHKLGQGSVEWMLIPVAVSNRLPTDENGYGHTRYLRELAAPLNVAISETPAPRTLAEIEFGVRYLHRWDDLELSGFVFRGHQRSPVLTINPAVGSLVQSHPGVVTLGAFGSYSGEAWILRAHALLQPSHQARVNVLPNDATETLARGGLGFDYVFSKDLKVYAEVWSSFTVNSLTRSTSNDWLFTLRVTNETLESLYVGFTVLVSAPHSSWMLSPELQWTFSRDWKLGAGANLISSSDRDAAFYPLRDSDQLYLQITHYFGL